MNPIHKEMRRRSRIILEDIRDLWDGKRFHNVAFTWVSKPIKASDGNVITDIVGCDLPDDPKPHRNILIHMAVKTEALAILLVRKDQEKIVATLETTYGCDRWEIPIHLRGDVRRLGSLKEASGGAPLGILWAKEGSGAGLN